MNKLLTIEHADMYGISLNEARRPTEEEKASYLPEFRDLMFYGVGPTIHLDYITLSNLPSRPYDGNFPGCGNQAWIITKEDWDNYINLNAQRKAEAELRKRKEETKELKQLKSMAERQGELYTKEDARKKTKEWIEAQNEGGEGFVPHYYTIEEYERICRRLTELEGDI